MLMTTMDAALAFGFRAGGCCPSWNLSSSSDGFSAARVVGGRRSRRSSRHCSRRFLSGGASDILDGKQVSGFNLWVQGNADGRSAASRINPTATRACAVPERSGSSPDPLRGGWEQRYHPSEEIGEPAPPQEGEDARLTDAEIARTLVEVNSKSTLMFSGLIDDEVHENIILSDLPYLTDEHGDIYFEMKEDEDILQSLIAEDKLVQIIIGLDNIDTLMEMELSGPSNYNFGMEDITNEDSDSDDDYEEDVVDILEDEEDDMISSEALTDWANLETVNSSHPMHFASKIAEVVSSIHFDWLEQPSASIVVQGLLRPAFIEEHTFVRKHQHGEVVEDNIEEPDKDQRLHSGTAFYKLEMINIQLVSAYGNEAVVKIQDFRKAPPDVIAHSAANIISCLKAGGETTTQALKSLCWRHKGIRVEEAALSGVDSLGFDMRVCSGTQVQTLRFAFNTRATSELSAEKQLRDLLFPRFQQKQQKWRQAHQQEH